LLILGTIVVLFFRLRKLSNQQKQLIEEKEYLIREVHHRVKNNLQSLSSLAGLQMIHAKTQDQKEVLEDFSKRLDSISLTHTMLYQSQSLKDIPAKEYLQKFTQSVLALDSVDSHNSRKLKLEVDEIALSFTEGVSLGMITNELLSNTIKHNANRAIQINLELLKEGDQLCFHYYEQENGAGDIAQHEKAVESTSLGLKLIDMFIKKLKAQRLEAKSPFGVSFQFVRHAD
ncbi:MAG: sensor histidine kinase, partial [Luteibaculum sp.]